MRSAGSAKAKPLLQRPGAWICFLLSTLPLYRLLDAQATGERDQPPSVILISIDTLRADHLSAYGYHKIRTPHLDSFATGGTLFAHAATQIPLTLPSHTCLFTSTYPFANRVEENGEGVPAGAVTLASVLRAHGYKTAAFIGSDFLDRRFGLDEGFDVYDSPFGDGTQRVENPYISSLRRDGTLVTRAARQWLEARRGQNVFVFVHLFDLHTPYTQPAQVARARGISRYDLQLEYLDGVVGQFQKTLVEDGWWQKSLVVLLSDHGEGLGEHQEADHGYFVYESTLWVPLIIHWPAGAASNPATAANFPAVAPVPMGLIDVAPTILDFLHFPVPLSFVGRTQLGTMKAGDSGGASAVYGESLYAHDAFRWAPLRALRVGKYKLIQAPRAELYDLQQDPHELTNLFHTHSAVGRELENELAKFLARQVPAGLASPRGMSPETLSRLESVGYLAAEPHGEGETAGPDPKDRLPEYYLYQNALLALQDGHPAAALPGFRKILDSDPHNTLARFHLGESYLATHQPDAALQEWTAALKLDPTYAPAAEAIGHFWLAQGSYAKARLRFQEVLALVPDNYTSHYELAVADEHLGLLPEAIEHLQIACKLAPQSEQCIRRLQALEQKMK